MLAFKRISLTKRDVILSTVLGVLIAGAVFAFKLGPQRASAGKGPALAQMIKDTAIPALPLTAQSSPEDVRALMMHSHETWRTLYVEATTSTMNPETQAIDSTNEVIQIRQFGMVRLETQRGGNAVSLWVRDNAKQWAANLDKKTYFVTDVPANDRALATYGPGHDQLPTDGLTVITHPLDGQIPSYLGGNLFPLGLSQAWNNWDLQVIGEDTIAGRAAVIIQAQVIIDGQIGQNHLYWVDAYTGVILQSQYLSADPTVWAHQVLVNVIKYDVPINNSIFTFTPGPDLKPETPNQ